MVIFGVVGDMGAGKTLTATYLAWKNWYSRDMKVFSNYHLYKIPYYYIKTVKQLDFMHEGVACLDEMWRICDSRMSRKSANKFVSDILARSRKRRLVYIFTAQVIDSIDKRIRKVMDFCLPPEQKIICNPSIKEINHIEIGDKVLTHNGNFRKVIHTMERNYNGDMYEIIPENIRFPIKMTKGHPILTAEPIFKTKYNINKFFGENTFNYIIENFFTKKVKEQAKELGVKEDSLYNKRQRMRKNIKFNLKWKPPEELKKTDLLAFPILKKTKDINEIKISDYFGKSKHKNRYSLKNGYWEYGNQKIKNIIKIDNDFLEFLGYYAGDGGIYKSELSIGLNSIDKRQKYKINRIIKLFDKIFGIKAKIRYNVKSVTIIRIHNYPLVKFIEKICGKGAKNKKVPQWLLILPIEKQKAFLKGYLATDGHKLKNCGKHEFSAHSFSTVSYILAHQLVQIILRIGYKINLIEDTISDIGKLSPYKGYISKQEGKTFFYNGYFLMPIRQIKKENYSGKVYNLEVKNAHSYTTNSICCHNCALPVLMGRYESDTKVLIFRTGFIKNASNYMKTFYYKTEIPMECFDSEEEVDMEEDTYEEGYAEKPKIMWQEAKAKCKDCGELITMGWECPNCDSKNVEEVQPRFFETWEEANAFAGAYWEKKLKEMKIVNTERE